MRLLLLIAWLTVNGALNVPAQAARPAAKPVPEAEAAPKFEGAMNIGSDWEYDVTVCGPLKNAFGPFDFRTVSSDRRTVVETFHYEPGMQGIRRGQWRNERGFIWNEFDYTLRAMPNHHGALAAIDKMGIVFNSDRPRDAAKTGHCYFLRAVEFAPDDGRVRLLYGLYLLRRNRFDRAVEQLRLAESMVPDDGNVQYNLGLAYLRMKDYEKALGHAHRAYTMGFPLEGLKNLLKKAGHWREPAEEGAVSPPVETK